MQVLIVDDRSERQSALMMAFLDAGFQTFATAAPEVAEAFIRRSVVDLLVMPERVGGRLTHGLALLAEHRAPMVATLLLTPRTDADVDELFQLLPSLHGLLAPDTPPALVVKLALASIAGATAAAAPAEPEEAAMMPVASVPPMLLEASMRVSPPLPFFASARAAPSRPMPLARIA